jgi:hypothetical protein
VTVLWTVAVAGRLVPRTAPVPAFEQAVAAAPRPLERA